VIRPCKGLEPQLYECLASTFRQSYPRNKLNIRFCVASRDDLALPILEQLVADFPAFDVKVLTEEDDPVLHGLEASLKLGPNPKISNMSRAYREAKGDLIWIIDCNVWVGSGVLGRMVDTLCGLRSDGQGKVYKFVHQLPLGVDLTNLDSSSDEASLSLTGDTSNGQQIASASAISSRTLSPAGLNDTSQSSRILNLGGGRLEELFLSSSHAKFYTAINTVLVAPCIVGKSNMFRKSHLDSLTSEDTSKRPAGIDYFSYNICEDHLIGDLLWRGKVPEERESGAAQLGKHCMVFGDLAIQPMAGMSVPDYAARRVRWLRVRKFTVTLATLVEPGTASYVQLMGLGL
jgi:ceramide glucosyltransferase